jgi:hypothetical protein
MQGGCCRLPPKRVDEDSTGVLALGPALAAQIALLDIAAIAFLARQNKYSASSSLWPLPLWVSDLMAVTGFGSIPLCNRSAETAHEGMRQTSANRFELRSL